MQDYQKMINHFFYYCNVTITHRHIEKLKPVSATEYAVLYVLEEHPVPGHEKGLVNFDFKEYNDSIILYVSYIYNPHGKHGLSIDGPVLKEQMELGMNSMLFFKSMAISHYCPTMHLTFKMNKKSKEISFLGCYQSIYIVDSYSQTQINLEEGVTKMVDKEFESLNEDTTGMSLSDKLYLLAMERI